MSRQGFFNAANPLQLLLCHFSGIGCIDNHSDKTKYLHMKIKFMHRLLFVLPAILFMLCLPFYTYAITDQEAPYAIAERLQQRYNQVTSLSFHFSQNTTSEMGGRPQQGSGNAYFLKDGKGGEMRWNYNTPNQQVLVSDGETFSMYFSHLKQMIITDASAMESQLTYSFFTGSGDVTEDFLIFSPDESVAADSVSGAYKVIKLVPKEVQNQVQDIHLFVTNDSLIQRIEIRDHFGTTTTLNLSKIVLDSLKDKSPEELQSLFSYTPPEDTEIIRQ